MYTDCQGITIYSSSILTFNQQINEKKKIYWVDFTSLGKCIKYVTFIIIVYSRDIKFLKHSLYSH